MDEFSATQERITSFQKVEEAILDDEECDVVYETSRDLEDGEERDAERAELLETANGVVAGIIKHNSKIKKGDVIKVPANDGHAIASVGSKMPECKFYNDISEAVSTKLDASFGCKDPFEVWKEAVRSCPPNNQKAAPLGISSIVGGIRSR
ncbi:MAG: hypothetical protein GY804_12970 [Alphaproteobacteria bacterium]|nr:hypothetical protein [Alphaproteobacteria bacterium]